MRIPLSEFEQHVRPEPLGQGLDSFERGDVEAVSSLGDGRLEAVVHDRDGTWHPRIRLQDEAIVEARCTCEASRDEPCRHVIAVVFAIESGNFKEGIATKSGKPPKAAAQRGRPKKADIDAPKAEKPAKVAKPKAPKPTKTAADIIQRVPHDALVAFLLQEIKLDKSIEVRLKAHFADLLPATTAAEVEKRIGEAVKAAVSKSGKVNKGASVVLVQRLAEWTREANRMLEAGDPELAFAAVFAVVNTLLIEVSIDAASVDAARQVLLDAFETMKTIGGRKLDEAHRASIFQKLLSAIQSRFQQPPIHIVLATKLCNTLAEYDALAMVSRQYLHELPEVTEALWKATQRIKGQAAADEYARAHANETYFLTLEVERARREGKHQQVLKLIQKAISLNQYWPSKLVHWANLGDEILEEQGDIEGRIALAVRMHTLHCHTPKVSLSRITEYAGRERWLQVRAELIGQMDLRKWAHQEDVLRLYKVDGDPDGLRHFLSALTLADLLYWSELMEKRMPELYEVLLRQALESVLETKGNQPSHNHWIQVLRVWVHLRGNDYAKQTLAAYAAQYPKNALLQSANRDIVRLLRYLW